MRNVIRLTMAAAFALTAISVSAQNTSDPAGNLTYCLPSTTLTLEVDAVQEKFYAGPYARFAEKYLGVEARQKDETVFQITQIRMTPSGEADQSRRYTLSVSKGNIDASFIKLSSAGLVSFGDLNSGNESVWRFPTQTKGNFAGKGVTSNLTSESTVLYKNDKKESAYNKISVQQNMIVEKSLEKRAAETADMILNLRKQRLQIVTGDTDATYSGEAMGAAIDELTRLEKEYMTLFTGYSEYQYQTMNFDIVPETDRESQRYVAFRLSDTAGLVPADNLSGKPVLMEIIPQPFQQIEHTEDGKAKKPAVLAYYRIPAVCTVKLTDGVNLLLQSIRSCHASLLINRDQELNRSVLDVIRLEDSHSHSHTKTVVRTESSTFRLYPLSVDPCLDRILLKIVDSICILLRDHVDVTLKNHSLHVLTSRSRRLADNDGAYLILDCLKAVLLTPVVHILNRLLLML